MLSRYNALYFIDKAVCTICGKQKEHDRPVVELLDDQRKSNYGKMVGES